MNEYNMNNIVNANNMHIQEQTKLNNMHIQEQTKQLHLSLYYVSGGPK